MSPESKKPIPVVGTPKGEPVVIVDSESGEPTPVEGIEGGEPVNVKFDDSQGPQKFEGVPGGVPMPVTVQESVPMLAAARSEAKAKERAAEAEEIRDARAQSAQHDASVLQAEGQRETSLIWETTQMRLALMTVGSATLATLCAVLVGHLLGMENDLRIAALLFLTSQATGVIGFYLGKTNHSRVGGVGGDSARHAR